MSNPVHSDSSALIPRGDDARAVKAVTANKRAGAARQIAAIKQAQDEAKAELERRRADLEAEFRKQSASLMAQIEPLKAELAKLTEVAWTVDLYLGRGEDLTLVRDGKPAPAETPITVRQKVLSMAEESLVLLGHKPSGMDAENIDAFVEWLCEAPENLNRVLPESKGVVVLVPTWLTSKAENPWEATARNAANQASWWLIRNGERLYLLTVDPSLRIGKRLLPRRNEFTEVFEQRLFGFGGLASEPVRPGSEEWLRMEKEADARRRHYMRVMLVLQGLVDRTPAWHPLPPGGVNLLSVQAQEDGKVVLIQDDEQSIQLGDGRESFAQWQQRLNALLRPGLRVIGDWSAQGFRELREDGFGGGHPRLYPRSVGCRPEANVPHLIEGRKDGGFVIRFARTDEVWRSIKGQPVPGRPGYVYTSGGDFVTPSQRASCVIEPGDGWVLPYDLVTEADLRYYLNSREERSKHFLDMVPVIRAALAAKRDEAEQEAPFRVLIGQLLVNAGADPETLDALVDDLVTWWKAAHTWARPLNGEPAHEAKAAREIVTEFALRQKASGTGEREQMIRLGKSVPGTIAVAMNKRGQWFAYAPSAPAHDAGVFLDITPLRKDGTTGDVKTWQKVQQRTASALQVAWSDETWATWNFSVNANHYLTGPERQGLIETVLQGVASPLCVTERFDVTRPDDRFLEVFTWSAETSPDETPLRSTDSPFSWHYENGEQRLITSTTYRVVKKPGKSVTVERVRYYQEAFGRYSVSTPYGNVPWWPENATRYADTDSRPRLVWSDEVALGRLGDYVTRCAELGRKERAERRAFEEDAYRYSTPVGDLIRAQRDALLHEQFVEDFGPDSEDLWPAHRDSITKGVEPIHPRDLWALIACSLKHGAPVVGKTLDELADFAKERSNAMPGEWHGGNSRIDVKEFGSIVVPEPPHSDDHELTKE